MSALASEAGPRETALGRVQKLFRTTAFKLSLAYLAIFALCAFLALGYVAWNARAVLDDQIVSTIDAEINGLSEQYNAGGLRRLIGVVERRSREPGASLYLVTTAGDERVVGNVAQVPAGVLARPGQSETRYVRGEADTMSHRAIVRVFTLPGGFRLLVGRDVEERDRLRAVIGRAFLTSLAAVVALGVIGGWLAASRVLRRVDAMTLTTRAIMAGDLDGRLHVAGNGDELDRLASSLNLMLERIGELMRGMREVSDNIAHDLKTPLTRLRNRADAALRGGASREELRAALEAVIDEGDGLIRVFNALLMIARLEAGNVRELMAPLDIGPAVRAVGELYEALAEDQGLTLAVRAEDGLTIAGNRELIGQALANLIDNALKYGAGTSGSRIAVEAWRAGEQVRLTVCDRGPGFPEPDGARVLGRFVRLEDARSRPGFGLGLSLVNAVVRLHQGTLHLADNAPGLKVEIAFPAVVHASQALSGSTADVPEPRRDAAIVDSSAGRGSRSATPKPVEGRASALARGSSSGSGPTGRASAGGREAPRRRYPPPSCRVHDGRPRYRLAQRPGARWRAGGAGPGDHADGIETRRPQGARRQAHRRGAAADRRGGPGRHHRGPGRRQIDDDRCPRFEPHGVRAQSGGARRRSLLVAHRRVDPRRQDADGPPQPGSRRVHPPVALRIIEDALRRGRPCCSARRRAST